ncbi:winged helix-turn-helix transcriptional regulator [uncultured Jatrophihabitans sp.]|uniref:winged helix-turn-helix transcriptional regulator n=1 Tax=uncultured Jatrophihabitans sp. TaxID=1610747 RepID=UPI0035CBC8DB
MPEDAVTLQGVLADRDAWSTANCPVGRSMELIGTRSAMLLMREAYYGTTRFDDFARRVGVTEAVAAARLRELTEAGLLRREPYREPGQRTRHEYRLTDMGRDLAPVVLGLYQWGVKYLAGGRPMPRLRHADCGSDVHVTVTCAEGHDVPLREVDVEPARRPSL